MITITKPIVRRTLQGHVIQLTPEMFGLSSHPGPKTTLLRRDIVRQVAECERGEPIVVELRPRAVTLRLKGHHQGMEIAYTALEQELTLRKLSQLSYGALYWILIKREASRESREKFIARRSA